MKIKNRYEEAAIFISSQNSAKILETYRVQKSNAKRTYVVYMKNMKNRKNIERKRETHIDYSIFIETSKPSFSPNKRL
jgi:hypothetical protein